MKIRAAVVGVGAVLAPAWVQADAPVPAPTSAAVPAEVQIVPAENGRIGAWLVAGPFHSATFGNAAKKRPPFEALNQPAEGVDESRMTPLYGRRVDGDPSTPPSLSSPRNRSPLWTLAASNEGAIDLQALLHASEPDVIAYVAGTLHAVRGGRYYLLVGADDGVRVSIDGRPIFVRDESRPERDDDDMIALDLAAGDHTILFKLQT